MTLEQLQQFFGWCTLINLGFFLWWFGFFAFAHDLVYRMHTRWFRLSESRFDAIHYGGMAVYKLFIVVFNLVPYLVLRILA